mmetsp:Transcript_8722/g.16003  ORF Transcript_8722/g.16003 Transcript_8722/m.16003 type:complete len:228 (-) Transcript_8722:2023-2706(-)
MRRMYSELQQICFTPSPKSTVELSLLLPVPKVTTVPLVRRTARPGSVQTIESTSTSSPREKFPPSTLNPYDSNSPSSFSTPSALEHVNTLRTLLNTTPLPSLPKSRKPQTRMGLCPETTSSIDNNFTSRYCAFITEIKKPRVHVQPLRHHPADVGAQIGAVVRPRLSEAVAPPRYATSAPRETTKLAGRVLARRDLSARAESCGLRYWLDGRRGTHPFLRSSDGTLK